MSSVWTQFKSFLAARAQARKLMDYPATYKAVAPDSRINQPDVFDPALKHFRYGFRKGEPTFTDETIARSWWTAQDRATFAVLKTVNSSAWKEHLILRGSAVVRAWYGNRARHPRDLDWVVQPATLKMQDALAKQLVSGVIQAVLSQGVADAPDQPPIEFESTSVANDEIWNYDRAPGTRVMFPWKSPDLPPGGVQCDLVFAESLPLPPVLTSFENPIDHDALQFTTVSKEMSLAWKIKWLHADPYPQGKDLYDAVLLAEDVLPPVHVVRELINADSKPYYKRHPFVADSVLGWEVDWETFVLEYPWVKGTAEEWKQRLADAIRPGFSTSSS